MEATSMKNAPFKYLWVDAPNPDALLTLGSLQFSEHTAIRNIEQMLSDVRNLVECSLAIFRGLYPSESPFFIWGEVRKLPWWKDYWSEWNELMRPHLVEDEVVRIFSDLGMNGDEFSPADFPAHTYGSTRLCSDPKLMVQGLVVETLLAADRFLHFVVRNELGEAVNALAVSFKFHLEVIQLALPLAEPSNINLSRSATCLE